MKTERYIIQLLARNGSVTVPGLGTFTIEHRNATPTGSTILPPGDVVVFRADTGCRDNTLAETIMRKEKIRFEDAAAMVREAAGTLDVDQFRGWHNWLPQNYGLTVIPVKEIRRDNLFMDFGKYAAAVAFALLLNISVPVNEVSESAEARIIPEFFADTPKSVEEETVVAETAEPKEFCVIVSSLNSRQDAMDWIIARAGCDTMEIIEGDGHYRISAARFATYHEAATFIKEENLQAWVLHTK